MQTRRERALKVNLKRIGVGIFLVIFVASVVGVALITITSTGH
jgi:hypothetical protein